MTIKQSNNYIPASSPKRKLSIPHFPAPERPEIQTIIEQNEDADD